MHRRAFLRRSCVAGALAGAGCLGVLETESVWSGAPLVENRPDAVYLPASTEEMGQFGTVDLDDGAHAALFFTFPHRFWTVQGSSKTRVEVSESASMHLMVSVWDPESGLVLPRQPAATVLQDGDTEARLQVWAMIAQRMGYHFGNNVALPGDGSYEIQVRFDPVGVRTAGTLAGRFETASVATVPIEFDSDDVTSLDVNEVPRDQRGARDASPPMTGMDQPVGQAPPVEGLPGRALGTGRSGDAVLAGRLLDSAPEGIDGQGPYLAASLRSPYNRIVLGNASLSATLGDARVHLVETLHHELGHHYGAALGELLEEGPTVNVETPPQVARHDGYETAFFDMEPVELDAP